MSEILVNRIIVLQTEKNIPFVRQISANMLVSLNGCSSHGKIKEYSFKG